MPAANALMPATRRSLLADVRALGVAASDIVMVHASVRSIGPIIGGVNTVVQALLDAVGDEGTLAAYADWELGFDDTDIAGALADDVPAFDKRIAKAAREYGILPETIRTWPGAVRSDNPEAGVVAVGARAARLCADHALSYGYGDDSPYAKLVAADATVLLLGAPLDTITLLHHAEHVARIERKRVRRYRRKLLAGTDEHWVDIEEFDTAGPVVDGMPDDCFARIAEIALARGHGRHGLIGNAGAYAFGAAELHRTGVQWLEAWR
jgi:aminoglycoside 3-N-acetyltransferase